MKNVFVTQTDDDSIPMEGSPYYKPYFVRRIFHTLRFNMQLLENPGYKRLYDECLEHLFQRAVLLGEAEESEREECYEIIRYLADLNARYPEKRLPLKDVDAFLNERKAVWAKHDK